MLLRAWTSSVTAGASGWRRATSNSSVARFTSAHAVVLEPSQHFRPPVCRGFGAIARAVIGVEAVRGVGVDLEFAGLARRLARRLTLLDRVLRDALVGAAVECEHRAFHIGGDIEWILWSEFARFAVGPVPRDCRLQVGVVGGIHPGRPTAPAEASDRELIGVGLAG